jgi:hypothetical protein
MTGLLAIAKTGSASAVGLVIVIWFVVPYNVLALTEPPPIERIPVDARLAKLRTGPVNSNRGFPATPLPFVILSPEPTVKVLAATVLELVLAIMPVRAASRLPEAPFRVSR